MMGSLSAVTWVVFGVWMAVGLVFYFGYGYRRSRLATPAVPAPEVAAPEEK
jgi:APA family basic amino acid/polyamine antiporter